ncbi:dihydrofolate reductase [Neptunomonas antarctica]|uniref:Dihydrofolate reductase n=2 Tax=Neptunomonas antarctica TaxID=619304 RepID=A0A1N7MJ62_9GAMM|nr:dihydrofolate reductase [Neptunomonas antarctica]
MIVAQAQNRVIGRQNKLPWYLPGDLKYFKLATMGKPLIMGRKTYDSIGRPLPGRLNIVITRDTTYTLEGAKVVHSLAEAIELAASQAFIDGAEEAMVIGGEQIYAEALPLVERLYVTEVHAVVDGDAYFPSFAVDEWQELGREDFKAEGPNPYDYSFVVYQRAS